MGHTPSLTTVAQLVLALILVISASLPGSFLTRMGTRAHAATYLAIALGVGAVSAQVIFHILPEVFHEVLPEHGVAWSLLIAILGFFGLYYGEKALHHFSHGNHNHVHCPDGELDEKGVEAWPLLIPSALHNIFDGTLIGISFAIDPFLGWGAAASVFLHELALKASILSLLFERGVQAKNALKGVILASLTIVAGAFAGVFLGEAAGEVWWSIPLIAGGYLFILRSMLLTLSRKRAVQPIWKTLLVGLIGFTLLTILFTQLSSH